MSFLDNLENNLKALESLEAGGIDDRKRRELEREQAIAAAPWAERLKNSPYVGKLMREMTREGFSRRMKVNFIWIGRVLRLEAMGERLELVPTARGVEAVSGERRMLIDLDKDPGSLIKDWLELLDQKRRELDAVPVVEFDDE